MKIRDFRSDDAERIGDIAVAAFSQYRSQYDDWPGMAAGLRNMSRLAEQGEIIVAERDDEVIGAVAYIPPDQPKADYFDPAWPTIRLLVVDPPYRGHGAGRALTEACIDRARRDDSPVIALHTSPIMSVALPLYLRMGFKHVRDAPPIRGVAYSVYMKSLRD